jgi:hypothetical protein
LPIERYGHPEFGRPRTLNLFHDFRSENDQKVIM